MAEIDVPAQSVAPPAAPGSGSGATACADGQGSTVHTAARALALGRGAVLVGLIGCSALVPLMPTNDLKADLTLLSGLILLLGLYLVWRGRAVLSRSSLDLPLLAFLLAAVLATVFSPRPFLSLFPSRSRGDGLLVYAVYVLMAWAAARLKPDDLRVVLKAVLASATIIGAVAVAQFYGSDPLRWVGLHAITPGQFFGILTPPTADLPLFGWRSFATLGNPIFLGGYALLILPIVIALLLATSGRPPILAVLSVVLAVVYAALVLSASRVAFAGLALSWGALLLLPPRVPRLWRRVVLTAVLLMVVTAVLTLTGPGDQLIGRVKGGVSAQDASLRMKVFVWKHIIPLIAQRPLFGWGFSNLAGRFPGIGSKEYFEIYGFALSGIDTAHNETLHIAFSTGVIGLAAYLWIWAVVLKSLLASVRRDAGHRAAAAGMLAAMAGYFLWLQSAWSHIGPANVFWMLAGGSAALARSAQDVPSSPRDSPKR